MHLRGGGRRPRFAGVKRYTLGVGKKKGGYCRRKKGLDEEKVKSNRGETRTCEGGPACRDTKRSHAGKTNRLTKVEKTPGEQRGQQRRRKERKIDSFEENTFEKKLRKSLT